MPKKKIIIAVIVLLLIGGGITTGVIFSHKKSETIFNTTYVSGNLAGNLYNSGLFCEHNGMIYFANPNDNYHLYSMTSEGTDLTLIKDDIVSYINADDNYLYYVRNNLSGSRDSDFSFLNINTNSLIRCDHDGEDLIVLDEAPCMYASLVGNYVYYIHYDTTSASTLYRVKIDGSEREQLASAAYLPCSSNAQNIYYNGLEADHNIYRFDSSSKTANCIYPGNFWMPQATSDRNVYALDCMNNYALLKLDLEAMTFSQIVDDRIDCYNVYGDYIYYQKSDPDSPCLCRIRTDGSGYEEIAAGNYTEINVTSRYVYFRMFGSDTSFFCTPTTGKIHVTSFSPIAVEK